VDKLISSFVLGYHGCDADTAEKVFSGESLEASQNEYDWLGHGIYFWEANPQRGLDYAKALKGIKRAPKIKTPAVIGAVIDLGYCLDLMNASSINQIRTAYKDLKRIFDAADKPLPKNSDDLMRRNLDCAVVEYLHDVRKNDGQPALETVRGVFIEGEPLYPNAGFCEQTHIQICVRAPENIKGVFRVDGRFLK
jgi:hypothetical protein